MGQIDWRDSLTREKSLWVPPSIPAQLTEQAVRQASNHAIGNVIDTVTGDAFLRNGSSKNLNFKL